MSTEDGDMEIDVFYSQGGISISQIQGGNDGGQGDYGELQLLEMFVEEKVVTLGWA